MTNPFSMFGAGFDPSQMDPHKMMELSRLVQGLPPELLSRMQTIMHNAQAGFGVTKELEEFEKALPEGFREKVAAVMASPSHAGSAAPIEAAPLDPAKMNVREARLTILRAVAEGRMSPEEAEPLLT